MQQHRSRGRTYLDGIVAVRRGGAGRAEEAAAFEHPEREHDLGVGGGVPEPGRGGLHAQHLRHRQHRVPGPGRRRLAQAVVEQHRDHCKTQSRRHERLMEKRERGRRAGTRTARRERDAGTLPWRSRMDWESRKRPASASAAERRARRSARRPRRRRNENPAAASRSPHRSDSARSRYMRRRSAAVGRR